MSLIEKVASTLTGGKRGEPLGTVRVVDPSPLNWLYVTDNTVEELVRVNPNGTVEPATIRGPRCPRRRSPREGPRCRRRR